MSIVFVSQNVSGWSQNTPYIVDGRIQFCVWQVTLALFLLETNIPSEILSLKVLENKLLKESKSLFFVINHVYEQNYYIFFPCHDSGWLSSELYSVRVPIEDAISLLAKYLTKDFVPLIVSNCTRQQCIT